MKQVIILFATIVLGIAIFEMIAGEGDVSIYSSVKDVWKQEISRQQ